ncbi:MAG TPA: DUF883 family protein [Gammaproteobacteria bacterium]|jgi:ElaB/YqjD/DUF883 family membrane-anchored ribosome-binding protein
MANTNLAAQQHASKEKLIADFEALIADTEELLGATAAQGGEKVAVMRERMNDRLADAKQRLISVQKSVVDRTRAGAKATDDYVRTNPWQSVAIAGGVGLLLGFVLTRVSSSSK